MILTKKELKRIQEYLRTPILVDLEKELFDKYGHPVCNDAGYALEYTKQDIYEQVRKLIRDKNS